MNILRARDAYRVEQLRALGIHPIVNEVIVVEGNNMSKIDAEDGAKLFQALVRTFKNTEIDEEKLLDAPAKLWDRFVTESRDLGLDLEKIAERVRRGK